MLMNNVFNEFVATSTFAIALFAVALCISQAKYKHVGRAFALFLVAVAINNGPSALNHLLLAANMPLSKMLLFAIEIFGGLSLAPAFWLYVVTLTSETTTSPKRHYLHFLLPAIALILLPANPLWPDHIEGALNLESFDGADEWSLAYALLASVLSLAIFPQLAFYIWLVVRRLIGYRTRLKDIYASTEKYELNWIAAIGLLAVIFWFAQFIELIFVLSERANFVLPGIFSFFSFVLFMVVTIWGLRLRPFLQPQPGEWSTQEPSNQKYDKSALSATDARRIEGKLRAAMEKHGLYRDPNLSLWKLSQHTGASPNYISQTLNEIVGQNFFDFVNGYRIEEAKSKLEHSDETILNIAYDVGFNSRSSFYTAFKKAVGETPSAHRKNVRMR